MGDMAVSTARDECSGARLSFGLLQDIIGRPACKNFFKTRLDHVLIPGIIGQVAAFFGVFVDVEQLAGVKFGVIVQFPRSRAEHARGLVAEQADVFCKDFIGPVRWWGTLEE